MLNNEHEVRLRKLEGVEEKDRRNFVTAYININSIDTNLIKLEKY
jgi:hypothetical protein